MTAARTKAPRCNATADARAGAAAHSVGHSRDGLKGPSDVLLVPLRLPALAPVQRQGKQHQRRDKQQDWQAYRQANDTSGRQAIVAAISAFQTARLTAALCESAERRWARLFCEQRFAEVLHKGSMLTRAPVAPC